MAAVILRLDAGSHQFLIDRSPIGGRINGHLLGVRSAAAVGAQRVQYAPQILVNLQSLQQCRFAVNQRNEYAGSDITTRLKWKKKLTCKRDISTSLDRSSSEGRIPDRSIGCVCTRALWPAVLSA